MMELEPAEVEDMPLEDLQPSTPVEETPTEPTNEIEASVEEPIVE